MKLNVAVSIHTSRSAQAYMASEALRKAASLRDCEIVFESPATSPLTPIQIDGASVVVVAGGESAYDSRFATKAIYRTSTADAIQHPNAVLDWAASLVEAPQSAAPAPDTASPAAKKLVAITSCPTGIAHTFMAAEALKKAAAALGHEIWVETQGSVGAKSSLTADQIGAADAVIIAADTNVDRSRFVGKAVYSTGTKHAMHNGKAVIETALAEAAAVPTGSPSSPSLATEVDRLKAERSASRTGVYKSLMTGVSYMLPVVVAGGLSIALSFAIGGVGEHVRHPLIVHALNQIGSSAFGIFVAIFAAYISYSIADRPGLAPGLVGGLLAQALGAGFLGGIVAGFLAGHITKLIADKIPLPAGLEGLKPVLILPFFGSLVVGLLMIFIVAPPVSAVLTAVTHWLTGMREANAVVLGALLGAMMAFDMGGPVNKAAYTFSVGLLASHVSTPMAAVMAAGMTPPLGIALATMLFKNRFDEEEREAGGAALVLGMAFITEGAIPFASRDPLRVIPSLIIGSATAGAISMASGVQLFVPHGGVFALLIPGAVTHIAVYLTGILLGSAATASALFLLKRPANSAAPALAPVGAPTLAA